MQLGQELRAARERAGLSIEQVADRTKIQPHKIEALEDANYEPLPHGIYLDGIVSAYAREVGIDPAPLIERARTEQAQFVADWSASQPGLDVFHSEDTVASAAPEPQTQPEPTPTPTPTAVQSAPTPPPASPAPAVTAPDYGDLLNADPADDLRGSTADNSTPLPPSPPYEPPTRSRGARKLALPILALIAIAGWAAYFYEATRVSDRSNNRDVMASTSQQDLDNVARSEPPTAAPIAPHDNAIDRQPAAAPNNSTSTAGTNQMPPAPNVEPPSAEPRAIEPSRQDDTGARTRVPDAETALRPDATEPVPAVAPANDVTGVWKLATHIELSSYARYAGLVLGYELALKQDGNRVTGEGRKIEENGGGIGTRAQTPISVAGTIEGDRLTLTFTENGIRRSTEGKFVLLVVEPDTLRGRFSSTAAQSSGTVEAHRMQ